MLVHHGFYGSGSAYVTFDIGLSWLLGIAALSKIIDWFKPVPAGAGASGTQACPDA